MIRSLIRMKNFNAKKLIAVLSSAAMIAGALPSAATAVQAADAGTVSTLIGDANNDNKITVADAVTILQFVANKDKYNLEGQLLLNAGPRYQTPVIARTNGNFVSLPAKEKGLVRSEGKEYVMHDGDVVVFRFNV